MTSVAIVIPVFNVGAELLESVASARAQTHDAVEIIVVDDGSTEESALLALNQVAADGVRVLRKPNGGIASAVNVGLQDSESEYVLRLDSDDLIEPSYVAIAAQLLDTNPNLGIVSCLGDYFGAARGPFFLEQFSMGKMLHGNLIHACSLFRRSDWLEVGGLDEHLVVLEDYSFWLKILGLGRTVYTIPETLFHYRRRPGQLTSQADISWVDAQATAFRGNVSLYVQHAEEFWRVQADNVELLRHYTSRYGRLERWLYRAGRAKRRLLGAARHKDRDTETGQS